MKFTPHARGSTVGHLGRLLSPMVYPACAGIDLDEHGYYDGWIGLPRMRGDRPNYNWEIDVITQFTPHARGSTY